jgi:hypothetical protein
VFVLSVVVAGAATGYIPTSSWVHPGATQANAAAFTASPLAPLSPSPTGNGFSYQGRLLSNGSPVSGSYDFTFRLYDQLSGGILVSGPISNAATVSNGLFATNLDFGPTSFNGDARYIEIATRQSGGGLYTTLFPRQPIAPAPYALYALKAKGNKGVVTVAKDSGDFATITAALDSITDASSTNRYVVRIAPGVYTETVTMKQYVDVEGSGEDNTTISQVGSDTPFAGTIVGASNAELRYLTVRNLGISNYSTGIYNEGTSPSLLHVTVSASTDSSICFGIRNIGASPSLSNINVRATNPAGGAGNNYGVYSEGSSSVTMSDVTVVASGGHESYGVYNQSSSLIMKGATVTASGSNMSAGVTDIGSTAVIEESSISASGGSFRVGIFNQGGSGMRYTVEVNSSRVSGTSFTIDNSLLFDVKIGATQLLGGPVLPTGGSITCAGVYDENYAFFAGVCP